MTTKGVAIIGAGDYARVVASTLLDRDTRQLSLMILNPKVIIDRDCRDASDRAAIPKN